MSDFKQRTGVTDNVVANKYLTLAKRNSSLAADHWREDQQTLESTPPSDRAPSTQDAEMNLPDPEEEETRLKAQQSTTSNFRVTVPSTTPTRQSCEVDCDFCIRSKKRREEVQTVLFRRTSKSSNKLSEVRKPCCLGNARSMANLPMLQIWLWRFSVSGKRTPTTEPSDQPISI